MSELQIWRNGVHPCFYIRVSAATYCSVRTETFMLSSELCAVLVCIWLCFVLFFQIFPPFCVFVPFSLLCVKLSYNDKRLCSYTRERLHSYWTLLRYRCKHR